MTTRILILYSEVMGYTQACLKYTASQYPVDITVVGWDKNKLTPYLVRPVKGIQYIAKSQFSNWRDLWNFTTTLQPHALFVSGWMDQEYLKVIRHCRNQNILVVGFSDNQWYGNLRQWLARLFKRQFLIRHFDLLWVSGSRQIEFVRKMGYPKDRIFTGFYSADTTLFLQYFQRRLDYIEQHGYPQRITYIGRLEHSKGVDLLADVFARHHDQWRNWNLMMIGNGSLQDKLRLQYGHHPQIKIKDFLDPIQLEEDIAQTGVFILPSRREPWGVVLHEMAAAGVPIICSDACGASTLFMREGSNGFIFKNGSGTELHKALKQLLSMSSDQLMVMGNESHQLSRAITLEKWAKTFYSIITSNA